MHACIGDVLRHRKGAECARAFGMHTPFGDYFAVEMREFLEEPRVLQRHGAADACGLDVLVVGDRPAVLAVSCFFLSMGFLIMRVRIFYKCKLCLTDLQIGNSDDGIT